jgi:hypothetical protein
MSLDELGEIAMILFPAGSLPDESDPIQFTARELEIIRHIEWPTETMKGRWVNALMARAGSLRGAKPKSGLRLVKSGAGRGHDGRRWWGHGRRGEYGGIRSGWHRRDGLRVGGKTRLKLESRKAPVQQVVVDSAEKAPTEN